MPNKQVFDTAKMLISQTGAWILEERKLLNADGFRLKADSSLVTIIDEGAERRLIEGLSAILPGSGFLAEESQHSIPSEEYYWIIDPIDGTTNFVHNVPMFSISVALSHREEIIFGVVLEMSRGEMFWADHLTEGSFLNDTPISVSPTNNLKGCLFATGFPTVDFSRLDSYLEFLKKLMIASQGIRRFGSAAIDLAYVACGRLDGFFEYALSPWDVAAGSYIVAKAGGKVTDYQEGSNYLHGREIVATNGIVHPELLSLLSEI